MIFQVLTIARNTFVESVRQPIYFILIVISGLATIFTTMTAAFSMGYSDSAEVSGDNKMLLSVGLATVFVCGMLLAAFLATAVISKEIERKTILTVVSKPVSRTSVVLGKYLGVATAIIMAVVLMLVFLQLAIRHAVMSTAADDLDMPVILFSLAATVVAIGVGVWCNFFYGWVFSQTASMLLFPLFLLAWLGVLLVSKEWKVQPIATDFKPQILIASACVLLAVLVLTSIATAASARLGQVMTIVVCSGVFVAGLMSNYLLGRHAINNEFVAQISSATPELKGMASLNEPGDKYDLTFRVEPRFGLHPGTGVYFGSNPGGLAMKVEPFPARTVDVNDMAAMSDRSKPAALVVTSSEGLKATVMRIGAEGKLVEAPPVVGDFLFLKPTTYHAAPLVAWAVLPNIQNFWLVDAVTQNQPVPLTHLGLVAIYAVLLIGVFLSLAVVLFQRREVG